MGHPLHPALVHLPIGCFSLATLVDIGTWMLDIPLSADMLLLIGIVAAVPAMGAGFMDFLKINRNDVLNTARLHMTLMLGAWSIYLISYLLRNESPLIPGLESGHTVAVWLSIFAFFCLVAGGWFGGKLVYRHRVGIEDKPELQRH